MATRRDLASPVREGEILAEKYKIERVIGSGGMGVVVAAQHVLLGARVAIKFLLPDGCANPDIVERFQREARAAARFRSEHVVKVFDVATLPSGAPFIVMEYLHGGDLARALEARGRFDVADATEYVLEACDAVAEGHSIGIVHRDLKPANLFLAQRADGSPYVKVLDFGISKAMPNAVHASADGVATETGAAYGSPHYMSPEQIKSARSVDARTDVWALGVVLYELLSGKKPFEAETVPAVFVAIANDAPLPLRAHRAELPAALDAVVMACLEKDPSRRVGSVAELAQRLLPFAPTSVQPLVERIKRLASSGHALQSDPSGFEATMRAPGKPRGATARSWEGPVPDAAPSRSRRALPFALGVGALLIAGAALVAPRLAQRAPEPASALAPSSALASSTPSAPASSSAIAPAFASAATSASATTSASAAPSASASASSSNAKPTGPAPPKYTAPPRKKDETSQTPD